MSVRTDAWRAAPVEAIYPIPFTEFYDSGRPTAFRVGGLARAWGIWDLADHSIVDVGAGAGRIARHFSAWGQVGVVEPNPDYARLCALAAPDALFYPSVIEALDDLGPKSWDVAFSYLVLQHFPEGERLELLEGMAQLSRRLLIFQLPVYETEREPADWTDVGTTTRDRVWETAQALGYRVREMPDTKTAAYQPSWSLDEVPAAHFGLHVWERA